MDQTNNNLVTVETLNPQNEQLNDNVTVPLLNQELVNGAKEVFKPHDHNHHDHEVFGLDYDTETAEILTLIEGATKGNPIVLEDLDDDDDVVVTKTVFRGECSSGGKKRVTIDLDDDIDECPFEFVCEICTELLPVDEKFRIMGCEHFYCAKCVSQYVGSKIEENVIVITCPVSGCCGTLEAQNCRRVLPEKVFGRWLDALCEGVISATQKFYCPYKDCSALLIDDGGGGDLGGGVIRESECPNCWRLFCAQCKVPWHPEVTCEDYQQLGSDERASEDIMLMNLAKSKKWTRCPKCKFYVERIDGCLYMHCRCGYNFCYNCGAFLTDHYCRVCKR